MEGVNKVIIIGLVYNDFKTIENEFGEKLAKASLKIEKEIYDKKIDRMRKTINIINVIFLEDYAKNAPLLLKKGNAVYIEGEIQPVDIKEDKVEIIVRRSTGGSFMIIQKNKE